RSPTCPSEKRSREGIGVRVPASGTVATRVSGEEAARTRAPSSSGLGRRPLKAVAPVRIRSGLRWTPCHLGGGEFVLSGLCDRRRLRSTSPRTDAVLPRAVVYLNGCDFGPLAILLYRMCEETVRPGETSSFTVRHLDAPTGSHAHDPLSRSATHIRYTRIRKASRSQPYRYNSTMGWVGCVEHAGEGS